MGWCINTGMTLLMPSDYEGYELVLAVADMPRTPESDTVELDMSFDGDIEIMGSNYVYMPKQTDTLPISRASELEAKLLCEFGLAKEDIAFYSPIS